MKTGFFIFLVFKERSYTVIAQSTIDKVYETARIEEVIGDFVQLKKSGSSFKGLSPFTDERTPSFMVSPAKQIWKDFSSGKGGNIVAFLMEHEHFTYPEAIKYLANKYNIEFEETEQTDAQKEALSDRESMYVVSEYANTYFQDVLWKEQEGKAIGLSYFKERGFSEETIKKFGLGYALDQWEAFTNTALEKGYQLEFLEKTGLTIVKESKKFDRFKGRVLFPIQSLSGRVLGFGGRILTNDKKAAKYLNSPESAIYHKSKVLYGLYHAKKSISKEGNCYLVEGYTDVIQMHQKGIENVVSSSGTALTSEQIRLIKRLTNNITVLFDGDAAGMRASLRGVDLILEQGLNVRVCTFPEGEDPDSYSRNNTLEAVAHFLNTESVDFIQFKAKALMADAGNDPIKKADTIRDMVGSIAKIPDAIKRELYLRECSSIMDISESVLFNTLAQLLKKDLTEADKKLKEARRKEAFRVVEEGDSQQKPEERQLIDFEKKLLEILLLYGHISEDFEELVLRENEGGELELQPEEQRMRVFEKVFLDLQEDEIEFSNHQFQQIYFKLIQLFQKEDEFDLATFLQDMDPEMSQLISSLLLNEERYSLHDWGRKEIFVKKKEDSVSRLVSQTILGLRCFLINKRVVELQNQTQESEDSATVLEEIMQYYQLRNLLSKKLYRVLS